MFSKTVTRLASKCKSCNSVRRMTSDAVAVNSRPSSVEMNRLFLNNKFKSTEKYPTFFSRFAIERTRDLSRIKLNAMLTALTIVASLGVVATGKLLAKTGNSVMKENVHWHEDVNKIV